MTAITTKEKRRSHDFYPTPSWATLQLLKHSSVQIDGCILECCSGDGAIASVLSQELGEAIIVTNDIDPNQPAQCHEDATTSQGWSSMVNIASEICGDRRPDWIVTNPPYNAAAQILPLAHENAIAGVAMLLRLSFLEPCNNRVEFLSKHPPTQLIIIPRISFTGDGKTDSVCTAWFVWSKFYRHSQGITIVSK